MICSESRTSSVTVSGADILRALVLALDILHCSRRRYAHRSLSRMIVSHSDLSVLVIAVAHNALAPFALAADN